MTMSTAGGAVALSEALRRAVRSRGWEERIRQDLAVRAWPDVVGAALARHSVALTVRGGVLHVAVSSGLWGTQLSFFRSEILRRLRSEGVKELSIHVGDGPGGTPAPWPPEPAVPTHLPAAAISATEREMAETLSAQAGPGPAATGLGRLYLAAVARRKRLARGPTPP